MGRYRVLPAVVALAVLAVGMLAGARPALADDWWNPCVVDPERVECRVQTPGSEVTVPGGGSDGGSIGGGGGGATVDCAAPTPNTPAWFLCQGITWFAFTDDGLGWNCSAFEGTTRDAAVDIFGPSGGQAYDRCFSGGTVDTGPSIEDRVAGCFEGKGQSLEVPDPVIGVSPAKGLAGMESYVWLTNYRDGEPRQWVVDLAELCGLDVAVEVRFTPTWYVFDYGDGVYSDGPTSGAPWPGFKSEYRHVYERSGEYPLSAEVTLAFAWRLPGGDWRDGGSLTRSSSIQYPVQQAQSVITE